MITPLDIENKKFSKKTLNGYDPEEVDDFLDDLMKDYEDLYKKVNESQGTIDDLEEKLEHYNQIESTLQSTLLMAQTAADDVRNAAKKEAEQIVKEAENRSKEMTMGIEQQIADKQKEFDNLKQQFDVYKAKMESILISQLELLKDVNRNEEDG